MTEALCALSRIRVTKAPQRSLRIKALDMRLVTGPMSGFNGPVFVTASDRQGRLIMHRQFCGQGLFEAMLIIACLALLLLGAYAWIAGEDETQRKAVPNTSGTAPSVRPDALRERALEPGAGGAGASILLTNTPVSH
jgi:hypothetical protein